jgi:hypothetical protein
MVMDALPIWVLFIATTLVVVGAIEFGYLLGRFMRQRIGIEKESSVSAIAAATIGLLAFILAFTFDTVSNRYEYRKQLVREDANAIRSAWLQADFLPKLEREKSIKLYKRYVQIRLKTTMAPGDDIKKLHQAQIESLQIQHELWQIAVVNIERTGSSNIAALYVQSLTDMINTHSMRVEVFSYQSVPFNIWIVIYALSILSMAGIGYQVASVRSRRSLEIIILALAFSMVIILIASIDRPLDNVVKVSQKPMMDLMVEMNKQ